MPFGKGVNPHGRAGLFPNVSEGLIPFRGCLDRKGPCLEKYVLQLLTCMPVYAWLAACFKTPPAYAVVSSEEESIWGLSADSQINNYSNRQKVDNTTAIKANRSK